MRKMLVIVCFSEMFWWWCSYCTGFHSSQAWKFSVAWLLRVGAWESVAVPTLPYRHFSLLWQCVAGIPGVGYCVAHKHSLLIGAWLLSKMKRLLSSILRLPLPPSSNRENTLEKKRRLYLRREEKGFAREKAARENKSLNGCISVNSPVSTLK